MLLLALPDGRACDSHKNSGAMPISVVNYAGHNRQASNAGRSHDCQQPRKGFSANCGPPVRQSTNSFGQ